MIDARPLEMRRLLKQTDAMLCAGQPPVRSIERVPGVS